MRPWPRSAAAMLRLLCCWGPGPARAPALPKRRPALHRTPCPATASSASSSSGRVDESHLTGESDDVAKDPLARPSLLGGSKVLSGFGRMLVTAVGPHSQVRRLVTTGPRGWACQSWRLGLGQKLGGGAGAQAGRAARLPPSAVHEPAGSGAPRLPAISRPAPPSHTCRRICVQSGAIAEMVADGKAAAAAAPPGAGDGLREETLLQRKLAEYATSIGRFGLGAAAVAWAAMTARFRCAAATVFLLLSCCFPACVGGWAGITSPLGVHLTRPARLQAAPWLGQRMLG